MRNMFKKANGSIAVYVTIVLLSFFIILGGMYATSMSIRETQLQTTLKIKQAYEK